MKNQELQKEIKALELIQKNQEKELDKLTGNSEANNKIKALNEQLKAAKEKNKEIEKKIQAESASYQKQHNHLLDLQEKYHKLKKDKVLLKKAIADRNAGRVEETPAEDKKSEAEILKASIKSTQKRIDLERTTAKKTLEATKKEIEEYQKKIKEAEQENRLNTSKLAELKKKMRHNQLKPLDNPDQRPEDTVEKVETAEVHPTYAATGSNTGTPPPAKRSQPPAAKPVPEVPESKDEPDAIDPQFQDLAHELESDT